MLAERNGTVKVTEELLYGDSDAPVDKCEGVKPGLVAPKSLLTYASVCVAPPMYSSP